MDRSVLFSHLIFSALVWASAPLFSDGHDARFSGAYRLAVTPGYTYGELVEVRQTQGIGYFQDVHRGYGLSNDSDRRFRPDYAGQEEAWTKKPRIDLRYNLRRPRAARNNLSGDGAALSLPFRSTGDLLQFQPGFQSELPVLPGNIDFIPSMEHIFRPGGRRQPLMAFTFHEGQPFSPRVSMQAFWPHADYRIHHPHQSVGLSFNLSAIAKKNR